MVDWVKAISARARERNPAALVIPQNGSQLVTHADFLEVICAIGIEDLFTDGNKVQQEDRWPWAACPLSNHSKYSIVRRFRAFLKKNLPVGRNVELNVPVIRAVDTRNHAHCCCRRQCICRLGFRSEELTQPFHRECFHFGFAVEGDAAARWTLL